MPTLLTAKLSLQLIILYLEWKLNPYREKKCGSTQSPLI